MKTLRAFGRAILSPYFWPAVVTLTGAVTFGSGEVVAPAVVTALGVIALGATYAMRRICRRQEAFALSLVRAQLTGLRDQFGPQIASDAALEVRQDAESRGENSPGLFDLLSEFIQEEQ